ncbi:MAG TPA: Mur ligase family protein, partial [Sphingobacteriaceae bacterium]
TRLIAHIVKNNGYRVGYTTSDGVYIQNSLMVEGDTTGPVSAEFILKDPTVEFAVLETARGGILRSGLGFPDCDIGVLTNIQEDHLGIDDIHSLDDLARVKSVLIEAVHPEGWAVINADDEYCVKVAAAARCNVAYFSMDENNPVVLQHCQNGCTAAVYENGFITIKKGDWKIRIERVTHVPITFNGKVAFMIQNALAASLAAFLWGFKIDDIRSSLETFVPSAAHTPGRMNLFRLKDYRILVDYAHNPEGMRGLKSFLESVSAEHFTGVIQGTGDRRDEDIREMGRIAATMFDDIIICQEKYLRGRTYEDLTGLLADGIRDVKPDLEFKLIPNSREALDYLLKKAKAGDFITIISDAISHAVETVQRLQDKEAGIR